MRPVHFARLALHRASSADPATCCRWQAGGKGRGSTGSSLGRDGGYFALEGFFAGGIMQFAMWLLGLTCHLSALVRDTLQYRLHPKQGKSSASVRVVGGARHRFTGEMCSGAVSLQLGVKWLFFVFCRKLHQAAVIVWNHHPAPTERLRGVVPPQAALQEEAQESGSRRWPVGSAGSLPGGRVRGALPSQPDRGRRLHRPLVRGHTLGSATGQRHGVPRPERHAPLLFQRTRQRQERVPRGVQPVHWPSEYQTLSQSSGYTRCGSVHATPSPPPHLVLVDSCLCVRRREDSASCYLLGWCCWCSVQPGHQGGAVLREWDIHSAQVLLSKRHRSAAVVLCWITGDIFDLIFWSNQLIRAMQFG